jgi:hypothetical protein
MPLDAIDFDAEEGCESCKLWVVICGVFGPKHLEKNPAVTIEKLIALPG